MGCLNDNIPDENYDFLIKQEEQKDGLDVYKPKEMLKYAEQLKCPLCKIHFSKEERSEINNILNTRSENKLIDIIGEYNREADSVIKVNNIAELEVKYNKIQDFIKVIEANRYHKHICKSNDICQRKENQDVYIDLCFTSPQNMIEKEMKIDFNKLKNDEEYRNNYLSEKEVAHNNYIRKKKRKEIENEYIDEFNKYTFQKERSM